MAESNPKSLDEIATDAVSGVLGWLADDYLRVEVSGLDNIPDRGPAMLIANHSGAFGLDALVLHNLLLRELSRPVYFYASPVVFRLPAVASYARHHGVFADDPTLGRDRLTDGHLVGVFPEGLDGVAKPFSQRYRLRPFSPGFAVTAMRTGAPVIPVSIVGAEETYPKLGSITSLARRFDLPYFPLTTLLPLPAKWRITVGEPVTGSVTPEASDSFAERSAAARRLCDGVWITVQAMVDRDVRRRTNPFW
ncbi:lysophospholipid acyltransferase family protein [Streptomyces sp. NRRL S-920]|uniref:lysophospholipid acyltransferase family protein n=1 Tax=Streptomyces sp. NRRL S-920 TaxID=1463921 RepID=UPI00068AAF91|nr:lysophospholipid acyltransferase family protein [Streptomyces sp. NRRL S-920]